MITPLKDAATQRGLVEGRPIVVDFFSGVGGLSLGLESAGFHSAVHVEVEAQTARYAKYNFPLSTHLSDGQLGDIRSLSARSLLDAAGTSDIALIAGGPPCQGFSNVGRGRVDDPLNELVLDMARLILDIQPKAVLIENVPGVRRNQYWQLEKAIEMIGEDYVVNPPTVLRAQDFGVPQIRRRVFIIGYRKDLGRIPSAPAPTHLFGPQGALLDLPRTPSVTEAIMDIPDCDEFEVLLDRDEVPYLLQPHSDYARLMRDPSAFGRGYLVDWNPTTCSNLRRTQHGPELVERLNQTLPGAVEPVSRIRRLDPDGLSTTIRAGTTAERGAWSAPRPAHPYLPRVLTTRECARIQSFPDWFRFHPTKWHGNRQVGNAVPPLLARAVGRQVIRQLGLQIPVSREDIVVRDASLIAADIENAATAGLGSRKMTHQVVGTDAASRQRSALSQSASWSVR